MAASTTLPYSAGGSLPIHDGSANVGAASAAVAHQPPPWGTTVASQGLAAAHKTFADLFNSAPIAARSLNVPLKPPASFKGKPAAFFSDSEIQQLALPFKFTLVGKFTHRRPSMAAIRLAIEAFGLKGEFFAGLLDSKHILLRFSNEQDYHRFWVKEQWSINRSPMRVSKWTAEFQIGTDCPLMPVWINLPLLPVHLFNKSSLFLIGRGLGTPMRIDEATLSLNRPSVARMCIELDVSQTLHDCVWIGSEEHNDKGFWQSVVYEHIPLYCSNCRKIDHDFHSCLNNSKDIRITQGVNVMTAATKPKGPRPAVRYVQKKVPEELNKLHINSSTSAAANPEHYRADLISDSAMGKSPQPLIDLSNVVLCTGINAAETLVHDNSSEQLQESLIDAVMIDISQPTGGATAAERQQAVCEATTNLFVENMEHESATDAARDKAETTCSVQAFSPTTIAQNQIPQLNFGSFAAPIAPNIITPAIGPENEILVFHSQPENTLLAPLNSQTPATAKISYAAALLSCKGVLGHPEQPHSSLNIHATEYFPKAADYTTGSHIPARLRPAPSLDNFLLYSADSFSYADSKLLESLVLANFDINWSSNYTYNFDEIKARLRRDKQCLDRLYEPMFPTPKIQTKCPAGRPRKHHYVGPPRRSKRLR